MGNVSRSAAMTKTAAARKAPKKITLHYQLMAGKIHVFTAREVRGLYITGPSLKDAFEKAFQGLSVLVSELYGAEVSYTPEMSLTEFEQHIRLQGDSQDEIKAKIQERVAA
jgi:hypothetical protein